MSIEHQFCHSMLCVAWTMLLQDIRPSVCLSVSPSVCLSQAGILSKRLNISSNFLQPGSHIILVFLSIPKGMAIRDVRTRIFWRPRSSASAELRPCPRPQDSVDNRPRTSADVQRLIARCQLQSSNWYTIPQRRGCLCLERGFTTNSLFCVTYYTAITSIFF